jgi:hypothetical protein
VDIVPSPSKKFPGGNVKRTSFSIETYASAPKAKIDINIVVPNKTIDKQSLFIEP